APAHAIGGLLGAHELAPLAPLETGRAQLAGLPSVRPVAGEATRVDPRRVTLADGRPPAARPVLLAPRARSSVPRPPGRSQAWGTSVIRCPFCRGWEARDARIGLLVASEEPAAHLVPLLRRVTADLEVFDAVASLRSEDGVLRAVVLPDGSEVPRDVLFVAAP